LLRIASALRPAPFALEVDDQRQRSDVRTRRSVALLYAQLLGIDDTRAVFFAFDEQRAQAMRRAWERAGLDTPLEIIDAPSRELGEELLGYLRERTSDPETAVAVVMHELRIHGLPRVLHSQAALYIKRLLLFEPRVILTSVPYRLE